MTTILDYIGKIRKQTHTSEAQISNEDILYHMNQTRNNLANDIIAKVNEDFFYDVYTSDTTAGANEYTLKACTPTAEGVKKIISLEVKRREDEKDGEGNVIKTYKHSLLKKMKNTSLGLTLEELNAIPNTSAFFDIKDSSIFIYPAPKESVEGGIIMQAIKSIKDLTIDDLVKHIFPGHSDLRDYYELVRIGAKIEVLRDKRMLDRAQEAQAYFNDKRKEMLVEVSNRYNEPMTGQPNSRRGYFMY